MIGHTAQGPVSPSLMLQPLLFPSLRPLRQIDAYQDLGCLPQLDKVDEVFVGAYRTGYVCQKLWPGVVGKCTRNPEGLRQRSVYPFHEVERDEEELVAGADYEEHALGRVVNWVGGGIGGDARRYSTERGCG